MASRSVKLRQRKCRAQLEAPCSLGLRDCDGRLERLFRDRRISRIAPKQGLTADAMHFYFIPPLSGVPDLRKGAIYRGGRGLVPALGSFNVGQRRLEKWVVKCDLLLQKCLYARCILGPGLEIFS